MDHSLTAKGAVNRHPLESPGMSTMSALYENGCRVWAGLLGLCSALQKRRLRAGVHAADCGAICTKREMIESLQVGCAFMTESLVGRGMQCLLGY